MEFSKMQYRIATLLALAAVTLPLSAHADNVYLKSGDALTGTITRIGPETVDLTTTYAGPIKIRRDAVRTLRSDAKVTIASPQGDFHTAFVAPIDNGPGWRESDEAIPPTGVAAVITPPPSVPAPVDAKAYYLDLEPDWLPIGPHWKNQFAFGLANSTGNTDSTTFNAEADFHYDTKPQEFTLKLGANYQVTDGVQTTDQAYLDGVYRRTFPQYDKSERWYAFAENHELYDAIKDISLRSTTSFGPGYYFFKGKKFNLDGRVGPAFVYERFFDGHQLTDFDALVGLRAEYVINDRSTFTEDALYTVAVEDNSRYQLTSDTAYAIKVPEIARGAGIKFDFRDDYDSSASKGSKANDTRFTLALTLDF
jgi:putative salt-induced outer membrane protein YdiY